MIDIEKWLKELQVYDLDMELMETAFTHSSLRGLGYKVDDYERLEFLGDAVIDIIVSDKFYSLGQYSEGDLTELRSHFVKEKPLAELFDKLEMSHLVKYVGTNLSRRMKSDVMESFFAVIYLEKSITKCREVWDFIMKKTGFEEQVISNYFNREQEKLEGLTQVQIDERKKLLEYYDILNIKTNQNAKNVLQQLFQKINRSPQLLPDYYDSDQKGPDNKLEFTIELNETISIKGKTYHLKVKGIANKKRIATIKAAEKACDLLYLPYIKI